MILSELTIVSGCVTLAKPVKMESYTAEAKFDCLLFGNYLPDSCSSFYLSVM
uniref:Uncharacterized protein n=1 Tax=Oryza punctata TaxID=4537 RepID=A0A0E0LNS4_ORYPU